VDEDELQYALAGHWHVYAGESLTDPTVRPLCLKTDRETMMDLHRNRPEAWMILIAAVESGT
jgi:hypothetical protein